MNLLKLVVALGALMVAQPSFADFRHGRIVKVCHTPLCKKLGFPLCRNLQTRTVVVPEFLAHLMVRHGDCLGQCPCDRCPDDPNKTEPGLCGCGSVEMENTNGVGCTFCLSPAEGCEFSCVSTPPCLCGGDAECCEQNPCCDDCPGPKGPECFVNTCGCSPDECCSTICPDAP
jgi:hypothetical protein